MRFLFTTHPGFGHLYPLVPIARALAGRGHEVAIATSASFAPAVARSGLTPLAAGMDWLESESYRTFPFLEGLPLDRRGSAYMTEVFAGTAGERMVKDLLALAADWRPDVLVRTYYELGAAVVGEKLGIPHAAVGIDFFFPVHWWKTQLGPRLAYLRSLAGLAPHPAFDMLHRHLFLSLVPPSYQFQLQGLPSVVEFIQPESADAEPGADLPGWLDELADRPLVHLTLGTVFNRSEAGVFRAVIAGLAGEPVNLLVTTGDNVDPDRLGTLPGNVRAVRYLPQSQLAPRCAVVINHGGFGTLMASFASGVPVVVIPMAGALHGLRCLALRLGQVLRQPGCFDQPFAGMVPELTPATVRTAVRTLLEDPAYRANVGRLQDEILALPGASRAAELLVQLARQGDLTLPPAGLVGTARVVSLEGQP
ncbi:MAG TPA: glycosyltransferase [Thermoanaerobaculia bacterium]|nr:glycosyltransferase [Thermoanaerobaculia bacterium]